MNNFDLFDAVRTWASDKGILSKATPQTQFTKLLEEVEELRVSMDTNDEAEFKDAIGDCIVVLVIMAKLKGYDAEQCLDEVLQVITRRTGTMIDGVFVKIGNS